MVKKFMNKHLFSVLEYPKIKKILKKEMYTYPGMIFLKELGPSDDISLIQEWQKETTEMRNILDIEGRPPFINLNNIEDDIKHSKIHGSILTAEVLLGISRVLGCLYLIKVFLEKLPADQYPLIKTKINNIKNFRMVEKEIKRCIDEDAEIFDDASPELKKIKQRIRNIEKKIRDKLEQIIRDPKNRTFIQDDIVTIRQNRFVVPIKQQEKGKFPGIIHDKSESGVTVFVEPLPIVEYNNDLRELYQEEKKEKFKILQKLTALVGQNSEDILSSYQELGKLDLILAKAKVSLKMRAIEPKINNEGAVYLQKARHPLLKDPVVPITIQLGKDFDALVITGPNTGGKTVSLKTVGLLHLMALSGMHIPAGKDSEISVFKKMFADIGDEQSIEQSLSTFSSHMKQIIQILDSTDESTLVLLDELGAGTDPSEGSALSMAILDFLRFKGGKILCTTHHDSLKAYAYLADRVVNARVEFDENTLQPTYEITIGLPGKSCAFAIAKKLGLENEVINTAQKYLEKEKLDLENLISKMEKDRNIMALNLEDSEKEKKEIVELKTELEIKIKKLEKEKKEIVVNAYKEAAEIILSTEKRAKEIINSLKKEKNNNKFTDKEKELSELGKDIKNSIDSLEPLQKKEKTISEGDYVLIKSINKEGIVIEKNQKKNHCLVQVNHLKLTVPFSDIQKAEKTDTKKDNKNKIFTGISNYQFQRDRLEKKAKFSNEINIRQMTVRDAQIRVEKYLDDAFLLNVSPVYIIHGKGKGILRENVSQILSKMPYVKSYRYGEPREGGEGVTVVYF
jgi:DNA mismatch repair protein MutS2